MASISRFGWLEIIGENQESAVTGAGIVKDVATLGDENATSIGNIGALVSLAQSSLEMVANNNPTQEVALKYLGGGAIVLSASSLWEVINDPNSSSLDRAAAVLDLGAAATAVLPGPQAKALSIGLAALSLSIDYIPDALDALNDLASTAQERTQTVVVKCFRPPSFEFSSRPALPY